jgi:hypothetical protein
VRIRLYSVIIIITAFCSFSEAFELQYPGEEGFFIGKPMTYVITADSSNEENVGKEGMFTFGPTQITMDSEEYYDCVFEAGVSSLHFYQGLDPIKGDLTQKGFKFEESELILDPAVTAINYPLSSGDSWSEETDLTAKNVEIPGFGLIPFPLEVKNVKDENEVSSNTISVPAGTFDTLLVEATFTGSMLGIPMTFVQRTWLDEDNVAVKRRFELFSGSSELMLYELQLTAPNLTPWELNDDGVTDILDVVIIAKHFGESVSGSMTPNPDIDGNGVVDLDDLRVVLFHFGETHD